MEQRQQQDFRPVAVLNGMAIHLRQTAERLRQMANCPRPPHAMTPQERETLKDAATTLERLDKLRQDLLTTATTDSEGEDNLTADLMSLLGLESGS